MARAAPERGRALLLPGNELDGPQYAGLADALAARGWTTTALTLPAFLGLPPAPGSAWSWDELIAAARAALREHAPGGLLIGHSLGGLLALLAAAGRDEPAGPARLALLEPAVPPTRRAAAGAARQYTRQVLERDRERFVNQPGPFRRLARPEAFPPEALARYLAIRRAADPTVVGTLLATLPALYPLPLAAVRAPVLLVRGARSGWRAAIGGWLLARQLPAARRVSVPEAGHWLGLEQPAPVAAAIAAEA